jgi:hypothetical protein
MSTTQKTNITHNEYYTKNKAIPETGRGGLWGCEMSLNKCIYAFHSFKFLPDNVCGLFEVLYFGQTDCAMAASPAWVDCTHQPPLHWNMRAEVPEVRVFRSSFQWPFSYSTKAAEEKV